MYDTCNAEKSEVALCSVLSTYSRDCAAAGMTLQGWRQGICGMHPIMSWGGRRGTSSDCSLWQLVASELSQAHRSLKNRISIYKLFKNLYLPISLHEEVLRMHAPCVSHQVSSVLNHNKESQISLGSMASQCIVILTGFLQYFSTFLSQALAMHTVLFSFIAFFKL